MLINMKINMRTIQQALNLGQRIYREWNKYQNKKARETSQQQTRKSKQPTGYTAPGRQSSNDQRKSANQAPTSQNPYAETASPPSSGGSWQAGGYPGDFFGSVAFDYSPNLDGDADPGEIVWAWVPYEEDYTQGKDRPVLIVGREGAYLLALMLTSKDHNNSTSQDPNYLDIGSGEWDKDGRESEVKLNRVIRLNADGIRREGAVMPRSTFDTIAASYRQR